MAMTVMVSGKIYNGSVHEYKTKGEDGKKRKMFRGRLNYRDRTTGEWYWIDAVCWKDFGDESGLVGFLEKHFHQDNGPKDTGGQPIEIVGYIKPKTALFTAKITAKIKGKKQVIDVPDTEHETYELIIDTVDFPPSNEKRTTKSNGSSEVDFSDVGDDDEFEIVGGSLSGDDDEAPIEDTEVIIDAEEKKDASSDGKEEEEDDFFSK